MGLRLALVAAVMTTLFVVSSSTSMGAPPLVNETRPTTGGAARYDRVLVADRGTWSRKPDRVAFRWLRSGRPIRGADDKRYRLTHRDVGHRIRVRVTVRRSGYAAGTATSVPRLVRHRVPVRRRVTYEVRRRGQVGASMRRFARQAQATYDDPRGWRATGVAFRKVRRGGSLTLWLSQASLVPSFSSACSAYWSCRVGRNVIVNADRWREASPLWNDVGRSRRDYRHLVVNHETGHWLGRQHLGCPGAGRLAPVMMQQSKGLFGCRANPWPTRGELG